MNPADWSPTLLDGVAHLHLSGYLLFADSCRELARAAIRSARRADVTVSLDPASTGFINDLGIDRFLAMAEGRTSCCPTRPRQPFSTGLPQPADAAAKLSRQFPLVAVTLGAAGALVAAAGEVIAQVGGPAGAGS